MTDGGTPWRMLPASARTLAASATLIVVEAALLCAEPPSRGSKLIDYDASMNDLTDQALLTEPQAARLLRPGGMPDEDAAALLRSVGFDDSETARRRLLELARNDKERAELAACFPMLLVALSDAATPDGSLVNFERYVQSVDDRGELFRYLARHPRAVEILIKLFVGSQFLTEILLRRPGALQELTNHKRLAEFKSRPQIIAEAAAAVAEHRTLDEKLDALRRFQHWELLRIGACDSFGLLDLKSVTVQLSLLADSLVQSCLNLILQTPGVLETPGVWPGVDPAGFVVLAFGKLGGEELNYSSDIDLVFLTPADSSRFWKLGQRLIQALLDSTGEGFLYRVDMRLRPWGRSGALVNTVKAHIDYLAKHGRAWEKQALLKARPIAGDYAVGEEFLKRAEPLIFSTPPDAVRESIREMKSRIEAELEKQGRVWGEVKAGEGSIRDVEFVTQCLQLIHGRDNPHVRSFNTMDGLVRLADFGFLHADEYRHLSNGYSFLRTVEHSLQLMHHKQTHTLPARPRELAYLARRLDFASAEQFVAHYERHCEAIRRIFAKYILQTPGIPETPGVWPGVDSLPDHRTLMEPTYADTFSEEEIAHHARLLDRLSADNLVEVDAARAAHIPGISENPWDVTVVGYDHIGELSLMCGLLFVYGFDIVEGNIFTAEHVAGGRAFRDQRAARRDASLETARKFVNVFSVRPPAEGVDPDVWDRYKADLVDLVQFVREGGTAQAHGKLAKRVAAALRDVPVADAASVGAEAGSFRHGPGDAPVLLPVSVEIDNDSAERMTVLHIRADDTIGFLYELTNALAMSGIEIERVVVRSVGNRVADTLFVTDAAGEKITDDDRLRELRAAVVLIKHFTHLLPRSPNPEKALLHFREFIERLFQTDDWIDDLSSLERPDVLHALARLLGVSNFLWEDFLRLQHDNLFPVVKDVEGLRKEKTKADLAAELDAELREAANVEEQTDVLNAFKDREMFRIDMRHILGHVPEFGEFASELSDLADVVVAAAVRLCDAELRRRYGTPLFDRPVVDAASIRTDAGSVRHECALSVCALGKCGGREMGFASDVELMFIYEGSGRTTGPEVITTTEYFLKLVESFTQTIRARQEGIFQIDLRLRPYGKAGSLAVSLDAFQSYFAKDGAAWPYERQALVKLRPVAGDTEFGARIVALRDELLFTGETFDAVAMRAMREKQIRQLVKAGTFNAKLSPGGLVDCEYLVQGLQITHGHRDPALRSGRTRDAIAALHAHGILNDDQHRRLLDAYMFLRRLIDALRMVRGNARDLTVPPQDDEEFQFLARRLGYGNETARLQADIALHTKNVQNLGELLDDAAPAS